VTNSGSSVKLLGWNVPAEDLKQIPEHWLGYEEPEASLHYLLGLIYIAFTVFSLTGNGLVIWVFSRYAWNLWRALNFHLNLSLFLHTHSF
jgi:hypothetical protein